MKKVYKLLACAVALIMTASGIICAAAQADSAKQYCEGIIEFSLKKSAADSVQEWIDGELTRDAGSGSEWYIIALSNHGDYDFSGYKAALNKYLSENEVGSASSRLKYALTYVAIGDKTNPYINKALGNSIGEQGIMSLVFGLHLLNNGYTGEAYSASELVIEILSLQHGDRGWSVTGEYGDVDVTAMTVQALAVYYESNPSVKSAVDGALDFLSERQLENGGYSAYGVPNPESCAQVVTALSSLGVDVCSDERFIKNGNTVFEGMGSFVLSDGSFCHKEGGASDSTATAQVLCASVAYENMQNGKSPFYIFDYNMTVSAKTTTDANTTETVGTTVAEYVSEISETTNETQAQKTEQTESDAGKTDSVRIAVISVCIASALICTVLFVMKKRKTAVFVIIVTLAVVAAVIGLSGGNSKETAGTVTVSISCEVVKDKGKNHIPKDGIILDETEVEIQNGDTVYDVLAEVCEENGILFSANMGYIEGINNLFEMDFGKSSGWIYFVNGETPSVGCGSCELADGDKIEWHYTCDLGKDLDIDFEK